jgi:hypothetical protein
VTTVLDLGAANVPQEQVFKVRAAARSATDMAEVFAAGFLAALRGGLRDDEFPDERGNAESVEEH